MTPRVGLNSLFSVLTKAALTMSDTLRKPEEKTMALGGVATGSMKAKEALRVQGIMTYRGFKLIDWDWIRTQTENSKSVKVVKIF